MSISYPLSIPTSPKPSAVRWFEINVVGQSISPYTLQRQVYEWPGSAWGIQVAIDPLTREEAANWIAFLSALRGTRGTFYFGDILFSAPRGTGSGTPKVNGANQTGFSLVTDGWANNSGVLKAGDMLQIDNALYRNLTDVTSDGSGNATLDIWPRLRGHADNSNIVTSNPKGVFRLNDNNVTTQDAGRNQVYNISFQAAEAL